MSESQSNVLILPDVSRLDELVHGDYTLRGPVDVDENTIMLGVTVTDDTPKGSLDVAVRQEADRKVITIARAASQGLLQVKSLEEGVPAAETPFVFARAVGSIAVERNVDQPWRLLTHGSEVTDRAGLSHFLRIVAQFGKLAHSPATVIAP